MKNEQVALFWRVRCILLINRILLSFYIHTLIYLHKINLCPLVYILYPRNDVMFSRLYSISCTFDRLCPTHFYTWRRNDIQIEWYVYECTHKGLLAHRLIYRHCTILMCLCGGCGRHCRFQEHITYYIQPNMECTWIYALHFTPSLYGYIFNALYGGV